LKTFEIFICHKKSSGKDFAEHLKSGLEELGYHSFLDSKDIPKTTDGKEEWVAIRDQALKESRTFILIITPGFDLSQEVKNELELARSLGNKQFIYFRHRDLGRKIIIDLQSEKVDLGRQEQVSFENKEELLRLAHGILIKKSSVLRVVDKPETSKPVRPQSNPTRKPIAKTELSCEMCAKPIEGQPYKELIGDKTHIFDCKECAQTFKKFRCVYGESFQV
jgi:hypothetical protein